MENTIKLSPMKNEKFNFRCYDCKHLFRGSIGENCPNCGSMDVRIVTKDKLLKFFLNIFII